MPTEPHDDWNPRFVLYAQTLGRTPQDVLDNDRMYTFSAWIKERVSEFAVAEPDSVFQRGGGGGIAITDQNAFTRYIEKYATQILKDKLDEILKEANEQD